MPRSTQLQCIQLVTLLITGSFTSLAVAQPTGTASPSSATEQAEQAEQAEQFDRYFHTYNTDFQYFFMRHRLKLDEVLVGASASQSTNGGFDAEVKGFMPLYESERFSFMLPFYFYRYALADEQREQLPYDAMNAFFWQAVGRLKLSDKLDLVLVTEGRHNGTEDSLSDLTGTELAEFVVLNIELSPKWTVAAAGRAKVTWDSRNDRQWQILPAGHVVFRPTDRLSIMSGLPSLFALEWATRRVDLAAHVMLAEGNNINVMTAARGWLSRDVAVTARFLRDGYQDVYVPPFEFDGPNGGGMIDQVAQFRNRVQGELELILGEHSTVQLKAGYGFDEGVTLRGDDMEIATIAGQDGFYGGLTFVTRHELDRRR